MKINVKDTTEKNASKNTGRAMSVMKRSEKAHPGEIAEMGAKNTKILDWEVVRFVCPLDVTTCL